MENRPIKDMSEAVRKAVLVSGKAVFLSLGILKYQDHILEFSGQVTQPIKDKHCYSISSNLKKMGHLQFCLPVFLGIHRNPKQKEVSNSYGGFLMASTNRAWPSQPTLKICQIDTFQPLQ